MPKRVPNKKYTPEKDIWAKNRVTTRFFASQKPGFEKCENVDGKTAFTWGCGGRLIPIECSSAIAAGFSPWGIGGLSAGLIICRAGWPAGLSPCCPKAYAKV